jgi:hypothetical protein
VCPSTLSERTVGSGTPHSLFTTSTQPVSYQFTHCHDTTVGGRPQAQLFDFCLYPVEFCGTISPHRIIPPCNLAKKRTPYQFEALNERLEGLYARLEPGVDVFVIETLSLMECWRNDVAEVRLPTVYVASAI